VRKSILFNTEAVKALIEGRKTQTRILLGAKGTLYPNETLMEWTKRWNIEPPYQVGDILYVRETWSKIRNSDGSFNKYVYKTDGYPHEDGKYILKFKWHPSIHMPKEAARIWLKVTNVRAERLQDISEEEARKEGTELVSLDGRSIITPNYKAAFEWIWKKIYKNWNDNPWVWVIEFERTSKPQEVDHDS
jgi:hypothetical protein